eukprot:NODE_175_length_14138_cov_1.015314.p3 type:complete len:527 gc:universal NODE_175_length_14138_cov_1.015314:6426-8006(+)
MLTYEYDENLLFFPSFVFTVSFILSLVFLARRNYSGFIASFGLASAVAGYIVTKERPTLKLNFNPFEILEMPTESAFFNDISEQDIKRAYRKLSLKWHPDRMQFNEGSNMTAEEAHDKFTQINLAKQTLLDPTMRENWQECGDPNGCSVGFASSMGLALPLWMITTWSPYVVLVYMLAFGIGTPFLLARWWYSTTLHTRDGVHTAVAKQVFKGFSEEISFHQIIHLICSAVIQDPELVKCVSSVPKTDYKILEQQVTEQLEIRGHKIQIPDGLSDNSIEYLLYLLFHAQLLRVNIKCISLPLEDFNKVCVQFYTVAAKTLLKIALARQWLSNVIACLDLSQLIVQANWANDSSLFQLPYMSHSTLKTLKNRRKSVKTITHVAETLDIRGLFSMLNDVEYGNIMKMLDQYPRLVLEGADFRVKGEKVITPSALVTCTIKIRSVSVLKTKEQLKQEFEDYKKNNPDKENIEDEDDFTLDEDNEDGKLINLDDPEDAPVAHAPFFPKVYFINLDKAYTLVVVYWVSFFK